MRKLFQSIENKIIAAITIAFAVVGGVSLSYLIEIEKKHHEEMFLHEARTVFQQVQLSRGWNANHGGVYVLMAGGEKTNPYLYEVGPGQEKESGIDPELVAKDGRRLTMKNPAMMTREMAALAKERGYVQFHLTSLKLINPTNVPDQFEQESLKGFKKIEDERYLFEEMNGKEHFRYMAPLLIEDACLKCHGFQGYKVGDIRGGISVSFPVENPMASLAEYNNASMLVGFLLYLSVILILFYFLRMFVSGPVKRLVVFSHDIGRESADESILIDSEDEVGQLSRSLSIANRRIMDQQLELTDLNRRLEEQTRRDSLTQLHNRRHLMAESGQWFARARRSKSSISTLMLDIDHFKEINDLYGHKVGDKALQFISGVLKSMLREYDMLVRFGGEEFLILLPDTGHEEAFKLAERIRHAVEGMHVELDQITFRLSVSIGVHTGTDCDLEIAISCADKALYRAKKGGRNRVCCHENGM